MDATENIKEFIIKLPEETKFEIRQFCEFLKTLSRIFKKIPFALHLNVINKRVFYTFRVGERHYTALENQFYSVFPKVEITEIKPVLREENVQTAAKADLTLKHGDYYPFLNFDQLEGSFLADIFNQFSRLTAQENFVFQIKILPLDYDRMVFSLGRSIKTSMKSLKDRVNIIESVLTKKASAQIRGEAYSHALNKNKLPLFLCELNLVILSEDYSLARSKLEPIAQVFHKLESPHNEFQYRMTELADSDFEKMTSLSFDKDALHFTAEEISTIFHFPLDTEAVPNLYKILAPKGEPPLGLPTADNTAPEDICLFAQTNYRNIREVFGIKRRDRERHMYIIGKSGTGKSKLMELLIKNDFETGQGVCVIDPHGDLIENIVPYIPESRIKETVFFNSIDENFPISFNPIERVEKIYRQQVAQGLIEIFRKTFGANWTPRLEHVLRMTLLALLDAPKASVMSILLLLTDRDYRQEVIKTIEDQVVKNFWTNEFAGWSEKFDSEAIMPILNKIGQFLSDTLIRNIVGQEENKIMMSDIMNNRKILLIKLPKGVLGEENTSLLGSMVVTKIYQAALARAETPENQRVPFYLYVDEFQNFATDSFANILSEARKYKLSLTMAHQYVSQLTDVVKKTVFGNAGTIISFRVGPEDALLMEKEFEPRFHATDITNLGVRETYLKISIDDDIKEAFSARTLDLPVPVATFKDRIVAYTRENFCRAKEQAEKEISQEKSKEMEVLEKLKADDFSAPIL